MGLRAKALVIPVVLALLSLAIGARSDIKISRIAAENARSPDHSVVAWLTDRGFERTATQNLTRGGSLKAVIFTHSVSSCELMAVPLEPADEVMALVSRRIREDVWSRRALWMGSLQLTVPAPWRLHLDQLIYRVRERRPAPHPALLLSGPTCPSWTKSDTTDTKFGH